jgi:glycerophosphoryl diester phosphodiesterase
MFTTFRPAGILSAMLIGVSIVAAQSSSGPAKQAIAHRGASGYAPEHTLAAYRLAMDQKVDFVEQDLAVSKDGVLICLHDDTLERTSNVAKVFPDRFSPAPAPAPGTAAAGRGGQGDRRRWLANDFTVDDIRRLDFGSWFDQKFAGAKIVTWQEAIDLVRSRPGIGMYPELKSPPLYTARGVDMMKLFVESVKKNGLDRPASLRTTPVIIQSFDEASIRRAATELPTIPRVFLTSSENDVTDARLRELATFATGIAPQKTVIARVPDMVARAHAAGLTVTSWTFAAGDPGYPTVRDEMSHFLYTLGIDALFTNNPDQFPRTR